MFFFSMINRRSVSDKRSQEFKDRRKRYLVTGFMAAIMVSSIFGFILSNQSQNQTSNLDFNGFHIEGVKTGYKIALDKDRSITTSDHPLSLENVKVGKEVWDLLSKSKVIGVTYNQSDERAEVFGSAQFRLERDLAVAPKMFVVRGMFNATGTDLRSLTCKDATPEMPIVLLRISEETKASGSDSNCVTVEGFTGSDVERVADRIILGLAGVMPHGG